MPNKSYKLSVKVDQIQLDPEDELTQNVDPSNVAYYIFLNKTLIKALAPARDNDPTCSFTIS